MKRTFLTLFVTSLFAMAAHAQTPSATPAPTTPGMVSRVTYIDVLPGKTNDFTTFIRTHSMPLMEEQKKQGLIVSYSYFTKPTTEGPGDWDLGLVVTYNSYADAVDFSAERNAKFDAIAIAHYGSLDARDKANNGANELRTVVKSVLVRSLTFNPMPK
jgi:hypothetical protein